MNCAEFTLRGTHYKFTFGFFAVWAVMIIQCGSSEISSLALIACTLHELGHIMAMHFFNIKISALTFYSGGISLRSSNPSELCSTAAEISILSAGCIVNLILMIISYAAGYQLFAMINLTLLLFNLLPLPALDGGRIIKAIAQRFSENDISAVQNSLGIIIGIAAAVFFFTKGSVSFTLPLTLALIILEGLTDGMK